MDDARNIARRSKDPRTQVGAVIVDPGSQDPVSKGYNGFPPGVAETPERWGREAKRGFVLHAELNAIMRARRDVRGMTIYVTLQPCLDCAKAILAAGLAEVVYAEAKPDPQAELLLAEGGVRVRRLG
jgi:dCMP deaminase